MTDKLFRASLICIVLGLLLTVLAVTDCAAQDRPLKALRVSLVGLQIADLSITQRALGEGWTFEANPLLPTDPLAMAAVKVPSYLLTDWAIGKLAKRNKRLAYIMAVALVGLNAVVVVHNVRVLRER